jgi:ABC-type nickel/cobalt efflux system permease component RcnA
MLGLDERIATLTGGGSLWIVIGVAMLLGLRHATDPDHVAAVTALVAQRREGATRAAARLGLFWGLGHAVTVFAFGLPIVLFDELLPGWVQQAAEVLIALVIVGLAIRLIYRWRQGRFHVHEHRHGEAHHVHVHPHEATARAEHDHPHGSRTPAGAFAIGLVHGVGGSAGVGVLIIAAVESTALAVVSLALLAIFTAVSMTILTSGFGVTLAARPVRAAFNGVAPILGVASLAFGIWYGLGAFELAPYAF